MQFLDTGLEFVRNGSTYRDAAERLVQQSIEAERAAARVRPPLSHPRPARGAAVPDGARARGRRAPHPDDPRRGDGDGRAPGRARPRHSGQHRRRDCGGVRRPRHPAGDCRRAVRHLARARASPRTPRKSACASSRCARSTRRITATTARPSGACPNGASSRDRRRGLTPATISTGRGASDVRR